MIAEGELAALGAHHDWPIPSEAENIPILRGFCTESAD